MQEFDGQLGLTPEAKAEKQQLMAESSHAFFRAAPDPAPSVPILGDCHALNAGTFRGPDGRTVWGLNDFDQAGVGSPEWDLERLAVSLYVASRSNEKSPEESLALVKKMADTYLSHLGENGPAYLSEGESSGKIYGLIKKAGSKSAEKFLRKWTTPEGERLVRGDKLEDIKEPRGEQVRNALTTTFPEYTFLDTASKPHSGGSTRGLERYYSLVRSPERERPWILETKAVLPCPVQTPDGDLSRGDGAEVIDYWTRMGGVVAQRQRAFRLDKVAFFTREREHEKNALDEEQSELEAASVGIGQVLARAHTRSGADLKAWVSGREDLLVENLSRFTRHYARQVESDFRVWRSHFGTE